MSCQIIQFPKITNQNIGVTTGKQSERIKIAFDEIVSKRAVRTQQYLCGNIDTLASHSGSKQRIMIGNVIKFPKIIKHYNSNTCISDTEIDHLKHVYEGRKKMLEIALEKLLIRKSKK